MNMCTKCGAPSPRGLRRGLCANCYESTRARIGFESMFVDAQPVREHVESLIGAGLSRRRICQLAAVSRQSLSALLNGVPCAGLGPAQRIVGRNADRLLGVALPGASAVHQIAEAGQLVRSVGTVRRLQALVAIGHTPIDLSDQAGLTAGYCRELLNGKRSQVTAATARRIDALFRHLQLTAGANPDARARAEQLGWLPALAWDEDTIDDPAAEPDQGREERVRLPEKYVELRELGYSDALIIERLNVTPRSLERALERDSIPIRMELRRLAWDQRRRETEAA